MENNIRELLAVTPGYAHTSSVSCIEGLCKTLVQPGGRWAGDPYLPGVFSFGKTGGAGFSVGIISGRCGLSGRGGMGINSGGSGIGATSGMLGKVLMVSECNLLVLDFQLFIKLKLGSGKMAANDAC